MADPFQTAVVCNVCSNGDVVIRKRSDTSDLYLVCNECMTGWTTPELSTSFRSEDVRWEEVVPTVDEICTAGWCELLR